MFRPLVIIGLFMITSCALAQGARSVAMGSVILPNGDASSLNPAYASPDFAENASAFPLPLGLFSIFRESFNPSSDAFDILPVIDQASNLNTLIFSLPSSPEVVNIDVIDNGGKPQVRLGFEEGSELVFGSDDASYGTNFDLPLNFAAGPVRVGIRPYVYLNGQVNPDADFNALLATGTPKGTVTGNVSAEAGLAVDVIYAAKLADILDFDGSIYLGVSGSPFIGFARADAVGSAEVEVIVSNGAEPEVEYTYEAEAFLSTVATTGIGLGFTGDVGVALEVPVEEGSVSLGLGLTRLGFSTWPGEEVTFSGSGVLSSTGAPAGEDNSSVLTPARRGYFSPNFGVQLNAAYSFEPAPLTTLLFAADMGFQSGNFATHLGTEASFDVEDVGLAARAGLGFDGGFLLGFGGGIDFGAASLDLALSSHTASFTRHQSFGLTASIGF